MFFTNCGWSLKRKDGLLFTPFQIAFPIAIGRGLPAMTALGGEWRIWNGEKQTNAKIL
jgi:hypothetical protein